MTQVQTLVLTNWPPVNIIIIKTLKAESAVKKLTNKLKYSYCALQLLFYSRSAVWTRRVFSLGQTLPPRRYLFWQSTLLLRLVGRVRNTRHRTHPTRCQLAAGTRTQVTETPTLDWIHEKPDMAITVSSIVLLTFLPFWVRQCFFHTYFEL